MYYITHNVLLNLNTSRLIIYRELWNEFSCGKEISESHLLEIQDRCGVSRSLFQYEYAGCLYANFIVQKNQRTYLSKKAQTDFFLYDDEACYKFSEFAITFDVMENHIEIKINLVDSFDDRVNEFLLNEKWSRNKSKQRYLKKVYSYHEIEILMDSLYRFLTGTKETALSLDEIIKKIGHKRKRFYDWTAWINFRGCYASDTFSQYYDVYMTLFKEFRKSVEWGGTPIRVNDILNACKENHVYHEVFINDALKDGMIRIVDDKTYSLTGYASTIYSSVENRYSEKRIAIILRKKNDKIRLLMGDNSLYNKSLKNEIKKDSLDIANHWYELNSSEPDKIKNKVIEIIKKIGVSNDLHLLDS